MIHQTIPASQHTQQVADVNRWAHELATERAKLASRKARDDARHEWARFCCLTAVAGSAALIVGTGIGFEMVKLGLIR